MTAKDKCEAMYSDSLRNSDIFKVSPFHCGYIKAIKDVLYQMGKTN